MRLAIVVSRAEDWADARALALAARASAEVAMFAMDAGVDAMAADPDGLALLVEADCELVLCATSALQRGLEIAGVVRGGQDDHAAIVSRADRVVAFT